MGLVEFGALAVVGKLSDKHSAHAAHCAKAHLTCRFSLSAHQNLQPSVVGGRRAAGDGEG